MDDLISRKAVLEATSTTLKITGKENAETVYAYIKKLCDDIKALPSAQTADAVEVVRCIDCKWCSEDYDTDGNVPYWTCKNWDCGTDADGFCHEAERKNDG